MICSCGQLPIFMQPAFYDSDFSGDVSGWNISKVTDLTGTFEDSLFDGDLSNWDTSSVEFMDYMVRCHTCSASFIPLTQRRLL